jgi:hypothetical protein
MDREALAILSSYARLVRMACTVWMFVTLLAPPALSDDHGTYLPTEEILGMAIPGGTYSDSIAEFRRDVECNGFGKVGEF